MTNQKKIKVLNIVLWTFQTLLALTFIWAGTMKLVQPGQLPWPWVHENPQLAMISGIFDLMAGFGLTLPSLLKIRPNITVYAAIGTALLMVSASIFHMMRGEEKQIGFNLFILISALFIAWGRRKTAQTKPKK